MLQPKVRHVVAQRQQEVVLRVMPRAKKFAGLGHQLHHLLARLFAQIQRRGTVGHQVQLVMNRLAGRRNVHGLVILARHNRRVHQHVQRNRLERHCVAVGGDGVQRGAVLPSGGQLQAGREGLLFGARRGRIEQHLIPLQHHQLFRGGETIRLNLVEFGLQLACARGNFYMKGKGVHQIAVPGQLLARGVKVQAGDG